MIGKRISVLMLDPSLFTAPYDMELSQGLKEIGVTQTWAVRPARVGEAEFQPAADVERIFYGGLDRPDYLPRALRGPAKALAHLAGLLRVVRLARSHDVVHFQWTVLPLADAAAIWLLRRWRPVVLTVHDTNPFNGEKISFFQSLGFDLPIRLADKIIVHTQSAQRTLEARGFAPERIAIVGHGSLQLNAPLPTVSARRRDGRWVFVLFGQIKPYKGLDLLVEAVAQVASELRGRARFVVAGDPHMDMQPIIEAIAGYGVEDLFELRLGRLIETEMASLFDEADCFLFPYRAIDASGVYYLTKAYNKWMIASRVGIFAEALEDGFSGALTPPEDIGALARAIVQAAKNQPVPTASGEGRSWRGIGEATRDLYEKLLVGRRARRSSLPSSPVPE